MRMKLIWLLCLVFFFGVLCTSCGSDNNEPTDEPGTGDVGGTGDTEVKGDYTATEKVKTLMMKEGALDEKGAVLDYTCGEFFMRKYSLYLYRGCIMVIPYIRHDGIWKMDANLYNYGGPIYKPTNMIMEDVGLVSGISDVTKKNTQLASGSQSGFPAAQPKHGYIVAFKTDNNELKHLRLFVIDYTLTDDGAIATVTVQYQLY